MTLEYADTSSITGRNPKPSLQNLFDPLRRLERLRNDLDAQGDLKIDPLHPRLTLHAASALGALINFMDAQWPRRWNCARGIYSEGVAAAQRDIVDGDSDDAWEKLSVVTMGLCWRHLYRQMGIDEYEPVLSVVLWVRRFLEVTNCDGDALGEDAYPWAAPLWGLDENAGHADVKAFVDDDFARPLDHYVRAILAAAVALTGAGPSAACDIAWTELNKEIRDRLDHAREPDEVARLLLVLWAMETRKIEGVRVPVVR